MNTMTRDEQIRKAANKYIKDIVTPIPASLMTAFIKGAAWSDATLLSNESRARTSNKMRDVSELPERKILQVVKASCLQGNTRI